MVTFTPSPSPNIEASLPFSQESQGCLRFLWIKSPFVQSQHLQFRKPHQFKSSEEKFCYKYTSRTQKLQSQNCLSRTRTGSSLVQSLHFRLSKFLWWKSALHSRSPKHSSVHLQFNKSICFESHLWQESVHLWFVRFWKSPLNSHSFGNLKNRMKSLL